MKYTPKIISIVMLLLVFLVIFLIPEYNLNGFEQTTRVHTLEAEPAQPSVPVQLSIPSIGVYAPVELVGTLGKAMAVPFFADKVGWYALGIRPGDTGSAVFAGHVNWLGGKDAVFTNLHLVQMGDIVSVLDNHGEITYFIVVDIKRYPMDADTSEVFSSDDGIARLNLITCDGVWNSVLRTHESRLVIFTEKI